MLDLLVTGAEYGVIAVAACGTFLVGAVILTPIVLLAMNMVAAILNMFNGGETDEL